MGYEYERNVALTTSSLSGLYRGYENIRDGAKVINKVSDTMGHTYTWFVKPAPTHERVLKIAFAVLIVGSTAVAVSSMMPMIIAVGNTASAAILIMKIMDNRYKIEIPSQSAAPSSAQPEKAEKKEAEKQEPRGSKTEEKKVSNEKPWHEEFKAQQPAEEWVEQYKARQQTPSDETLYSALEDMEKEDVRKQNPFPPRSKENIFSQAEEWAEQYKAKSSVENWVHDFKTSKLKQVLSTTEKKFMENIWDNPSVKEFAHKLKNQATPARVVTATAGVAGSAAAAAANAVAANTASIAGESVNVMEGTVEVAANEGANLAGDVAEFLTATAGDAMNWAGEFQAQSWVAEFLI